MDSSVLLVQAASGLQRGMSGTSGTVLKDSTVAQVSAAVYYQAKVISKLTTNKGFQSKFHKIIFDQIKNDFGDYVDAQARIKPQSLHHVYEWGKTGNKGSRLFSLKTISKDGLSFSIKNEFKLSKSMVPSNFGKSKYRFANKASVMEAGMPIRIAPRGSERLVFESHGSVVFMPKGASVVVKRPGGGKATGRFQIAFAQFFTGQLINNSIKRSGFQQIFNTSLTSALKIPADIKKVKYSFSANTIDMQADSALVKAFGGTL